MADLRGLVPLGLLRGSPLALRRSFARHSPQIRDYLSCDFISAPLAFRVLLRRGGRSG